MRHIIDNLLQDVLHTLLLYTASIISFALVLIIIRYTTKIANELFRKLLHIAAFSSIALIMYFASSWQAAAIVALVFAAIILPVLKILEKTWKGYTNLFVQRKSGEVALSLVILFSMMSFMITIFSGLVNKPYIAITAVYMWGIGDAAAALIGTKFGKHKTNIAFADKKKSWEGTISNLISAFIVGLACLLVMTDLSLLRIILISLFTAMIGSYIELITKNGYDTVTVPLANGLVLYLLLLL